MIGKGYDLMKTTYRFIIRAFSHCEEQGHLDEFFAGAGGRFFWVMHKSTAADPEALGVFAGPRHVAYVARGERALVWKIIKSTGRDSIRVLVVETDRAKREMTVEVMAESGIEVAPDEHALRFADWHYTGPTMPLPNDLERVGVMYEIATQLLVNYGEATPMDVEELHEVLEAFATWSQLDFSHDMFVERRRVIELARKADEREFGREITLLECAAGQTGHGTSGDGLAYRKWMALLRGESSAALVMTDFERYDVDEIRGQLKAFPGGLYDVYLKTPENFIDRLAYSEAPREKLWQFVSGIMFVGLMSATRESVNIVDQWSRQIDADTPDSVLDAMLKVAQYLMKRTGCDISGTAAKIIGEQERRTGKRYGASGQQTINYVYPQANSTTNVGCDQKHSEFRTLLPGQVGQPRLEKNDERKLL